MKRTQNRRNGQFLPHPTNGKYLGKFETEIQAQEWADDFRSGLLKKWLGKYVKSGLRKTVPDVLHILKEEYAIILHRSTLYRWIRIDPDLASIERRNISGHSRHKGTVKRNFRLTQEVADILNSVPNVSHFVEKCIRMAIGLECADTVALHWNDGRVALMLQRPDDIQIILIDNFNEVEKTMLQGWAVASHGSGGMTAIAQFARNNNIRYIGGR